MNRVQLQTEKKSFYNHLKKRLKSLSSLTNNFQNSKLEYVDVVDCPCNLAFQDEKIFLWHDDYLKIGNDYDLNFSDSLSNRVRQDIS